MGKFPESVRVIEEYLKREFPKLEIEFSWTRRRSALFNLDHYQLEVSWGFLRDNHDDPDQVVKKLETLRVADRLRKAGKLPTYLQVCTKGVQVLVRDLGD